MHYNNRRLTDKQLYRQLLDGYPDNYERLQSPANEFWPIKIHYCSNGIIKDGCAGTM